MSFHQALREKLDSLAKLLRLDPQVEVLEAWIGDPATDEAIAKNDLKFDDNDEPVDEELAALPRSATH